jgi:prepilin-type processing-associated H-X9-DG protein
MTKMGVVRRTADTVLFYDGLLYNQMTINANRISARHGRKTQTNLSFFDGHAETFFTKDLPGGMGVKDTTETKQVFSLSNLQQNYPRPLWRLEQQY